MVMPMRRDVSDQVRLKRPGNPADSYRTGDGWEILMIAAAIGTRKAHTSKTKILAVAFGGVTTGTESERPAA